MRSALSNSFTLILSTQKSDSAYGNIQNMQFESLLTFLGFFAIAGVSSAYYSDDGLGIYARDFEYDDFSLYARDDVDARDVHTAKIAARAAYNAALFARAPIKTAGGRSPKKVVGKARLPHMNITSSTTVSDMIAGRRRQKFQDLRCLWGR